MLTVELPAVVVGLPVEEGGYVGATVGLTGDADSTTTVDVVDGAREAVAGTDWEAGARVLIGSGVAVDAGVDEVVGAADEDVVDAGDPDTGVVESPHLVPAVVRVAP